VIITDLTSLILSALFADDAQTAAELARVIGVRSAALRPALAELVASGDVVTSGRTRGTRYCLAGEMIDSAPAASMPQERTSSRRSSLTRHSAPAATVDLFGVLVEMAGRVAAGATLQDMRAAQAVR
jgi:hypothetical protein